jgi:hypothetical protein
MPVKDNHPALVEDLAVLFADEELVAATGTRARTVDGAHGRIETRTLRTSAALAGYTRWPGLAQALCLERTIVIKKTGQISQERQFALTSLPPDLATAPRLLALWRGHWTIENRVHYVRDVTFREDASKVHRGHAPQVLAALRNLALGLLRCRGLHAIASARRRLATRPDLALALVCSPLRL